MTLLSSRNLRFALLSATFAATLTFSPRASATITLGSVVGTVSYTNGDPGFLTGEAVQYNNFNGPYSTANYLGGAGPAPGTVFITYDNTEYPPNPTVSDVTAYTTTFTDNAGEAASVEFVADDSVVVFANGIQIGTSNEFSSFTDATFTTVAGLNTLTFDVTNAPQPAGAPNPTTLDFSGSAATPEPSSLVLLGTGLLGFAGTMRRRFHKA